MGALRRHDKVCITGVKQISPLTSRSGVGVIRVVTFETNEMRLSVEKLPAPFVLTGYSSILLPRSKLVSSGQLASNICRRLAQGIGSIPWEL